LECEPKNLIPAEYQAMDLLDYYCSDDAKFCDENSSARLS